MEKKEYTIEELAKAFEVSEKTIIRKVKRISEILGQVVLSSTIPTDIANLIQKENGYKSLIDQNRPNEDNFDHIEYFTNEEYKEFHKRLIEYPLLLDKIKILLNELEYHKKSIEKHQEQQKILIESINQRNYIEAKEKGFDK